MTRAALLGQMLRPWLSYLRSELIGHSDSFWNWECEGKRVWPPPESTVSEVAQSFLPSFNFLFQSHLKFQNYTGLKLARASWVLFSGGW